MSTEHERIHAAPPHTPIGEREMNEEQNRRMALVEVEEIDMAFFSAERQTEDVMPYTVFALDPPEQDGIDCDDPEEITRLVVVSEVAFRGYIEEISAARRQQQAVVDAPPV